MNQLDESAGQTSWTGQLDGPAGRTSWMDQLDGNVDERDLCKVHAECWESEEIQRLSIVLAD